MLGSHEWEWMRKRASVLACEDTQGIVVYQDDEIIAACVADSFTVDACCVHLAIEKPIALRRGFLQEIARHLFITCGRNRIFGFVPSTNTKALKLDKHIGMVEVARIPNALNKGVDIVVLCMEKEACPWLPAQQKEAA